MQQRWATLLPADFSWCCGETQILLMVRLQNSVDFKGMELSIFIQFAKTKRAKPLGCYCLRGQVLDLLITKLSLV